MIARASHRPSAPVATFLVEREPGSGYVVTAAEGSQAAILRASALTALDYLGQPDPNGPDQAFHWIGPLGPNGESVGVHVQITDSGEARYKQTWYAGVNRRAPRWLLGLTTMSGVIVGVAAMGILRSFGAESDTPRVTANHAIRPSTPRVSAMLSEQLLATRTLRQELREFLGQPGLAVTSDREANPPGNLVLLVAVQDPAPEKSIVRWTPLDNQQWISLLRSLEDLDVRRTD